jgi:uncharacterized membrane protein YfcA
VAGTDGQPKGGGERLEAILVDIAGFVGGFVSTPASNGSSITLSEPEPFGLSEHEANGTNRLGGVALGLTGSVVLFREGLVDLRQAASITAFVAVDSGDYLHHV